MKEEIGTRRALKDHAGLETEFLQEIAEALGNAGERLDRSIARVSEAARRIEELRGALTSAAAPAHRQRIGSGLREEIAQYRTLRKEALEQYRWFLIQREAVGLRNHRLVAEQYRIPPEIRMEERKNPGDSSQESGVRMQDSEQNPKRMS